MGRSSSALLTEKMAMLAPMASARVRMATAVKPGLRRSMRRPKRRSRRRVGMETGYSEPTLAAKKPRTRVGHPEPTLSAKSADKDGAPRLTRVGHPEPTLSAKSADKDGAP